ncbi:hypothetical protein LINPERHAP1_LOCUS21096 [Linum perenne]
MVSRMECWETCTTLERVFICPITKVWKSCTQQHHQGFQQTQANMLCLGLPREIRGP